MVKLVKEEYNKEKVMGDYYTAQLQSMGFENIKKKSTKMANRDILILEGTVPSTMSGKVILHIDKNNGKVVNSIITGNIDLNSENERILRDFIFEYGDIN